MSDPGALSAVSQQTMAAFRAASPAIIKEVVARSLARADDVVQHGREAEQLITSGIEFTTRMLEAVLLTGEIPLLEDELVWAKDRLPHDGVALEHVLSRFGMYRDVVISSLPGDCAAEITPFLDWMIARQRELVEAKTASTR